MSDYILDTHGPWAPPVKQHVDGCKGTRVKRVNSRTQEPFWGCSEFPRCRWSESMTPPQGFEEDDISWADF